MIYLTALCILSPLTLILSLYVMFLRNEVTRLEDEGDNKDEVIIEINKTIHDQYAQIEKLTSERHFLMNKLKEL